MLTDLFILRGVPAYIRFDNGPEFIAKAVKNWIKAVWAKTAYIEPGSLWAETLKHSIRGIDCRSKGYCESFNGRMRDELLNGEIFYSLREAQIIIERWRKHYNHKRPHSALAGIAPRGPAYKVRREEPREDPRGWVSYPSTSLMTLRMERRSAASSLRSAMASAV